jgi:hypothetical protein
VIGIAVSVAGMVGVAEGVSEGVEVGIAEGDADDCGVEVSIMTLGVEVAELQEVDVAKSRATKKRVPFLFDTNALIRFMVIFFQRTADYAYLVYPATGLKRPFPNLY